VGLATDRLGLGFRAWRRRKKRTCGRASPLARDERALASDEECDRAEASTAAPPRHSGIQETRSSASQLAASQADVIERHAELGRLNHFELLGVPESADRDTIARAFQREALRFHPDQLGEEDEHLRPLASDIFRSMSEAYLVLENDEARERYSRELELQRRASAMTNGAGLDPDRLFQAARICLRRERAQDALTLVTRACAVAPHDLRYQALFAWLTVRRGGLRPGPEADQILELMDRAASTHAQDLEIRLYRAHVLQKLGRAEEAFHDFCFVANADPLNADAAREVRLYEMRADASGSYPRIFWSRRLR
jgi:curved DNA-binding protein CbpA